MRSQSDRLASAEEASHERSRLLSHASHVSRASGETSSSGTSVVVDQDEWKPSTRLRFIQAVTWINVFLTGFDSTVAASIYTTVASDFGAANNAVWVSTSYLITAVSFQALYGRLSDILGRRALFLFGTIVFSIGSLLCGISNSMLALNISRAIAGLGGGGLMTMATVVLSDNVPFQRRGLYQAANNLMYGLGGALGASCGGIITQLIGWRYVFLLQLPLSLAAVIGGAFLIKDPAVMPLPRDAPIDIAGAVTLVVSVSALLLALSMGGNEIDWSSWTSISLFLLAALCFYIFFGIAEARAPAPILPSRMVFGSRLSQSNVATNFLSGASIYATLFTVPLYFLGCRLEDTSSVGKRLILPALGFPVGAIAAGFVMSRYGKLGTLVQVGCVVLTLGSLLPLQFDVDAAATTRSGAYYFFRLIPVQIGQGLINPSSLFTMLAAFPHQDQAVATSTVYLCRSLGNVAGVAMGSAILQNWLRIKLPAVIEAALPDTSASKRQEIVESIRHSTDTIRHLPHAYRGAVSETYGQGVKVALTAAAVLAALSFISSLWAKGVGLQRAQEEPNLRKSSTLAVRTGSPTDVNAETSV